MKKWTRDISGITFLLITLLSFASNGYCRVYSDYTQEQPQPLIIKGRVTIQFEDNINLNSLTTGFGKVNFSIPSLDKILDKFQVKKASKIFPWRTVKPPVNSGKIDMTRFYEISFPESINVNDVINELLQNPNIRMAEPVWAIPLDAVPNDPDWGDQWAMSPPVPDPNFYDAWDIETGSDSVIFALIDSGIKYMHADLFENIWVNPGEDLDGDGVVYDIDDFNGVDDDNNGRIDDLIGYDFFTGLGMQIWPGEDGNVSDPDPDDFNGHGTHVAGIVAAATNNNLDVTGIAGGWFGGHRSFRGCRIMCLRIGASVVDPQNGGEAGYINSNNAATAINYAASKGADVINASWGGSSVVAAAAANAMADGVTFCHAAGNDNQNNPDNLDFQSGVISVASVGPSSDNKSGFSNWGDWIDVSAPGSEILSTYSFHYTPGTATLGGTSMASPMAAGLAVLIRSAMPSLSKSQVDSIIINSADSLSLYTANPNMVGLLGSGRIDAYQALINLPNAKFTADITEGSAPLQVQFTDLSPNSPVDWFWSFGTGDISFDQNPQYTYDEPGIFSVSLKEDENHPLGWGEEHLKNYIWVTADTMIGDSVEGNTNSQVVMPIYLKNTALIKNIQFSFTYQNSHGVSFDSFSVVGLRTEYFESVEINAWDGFFKKVGISMQTNTTDGSAYLPPDTGAILNLYFKISSSGSEGIVTIDTATATGKTPNITTIWGDFWPDFTPGKISVLGSVGCCVGIRGNIDGDIDDQIDIADLVYFVDYSFGVPPGPEPPCFEEADVNADTSLDIADIVYMVNYMFGDPPGPAPEVCP